MFYFKAKAMQKQMVFIICIVILNSINSWSFDSGW